jgi:transglutaminase-like putative cysteine protease
MAEPDHGTKTRQSVREQRPVLYLVLANLLCVHVTGAVSLMPMLGLYVLTGLSGWLARWRGTRLYSAIWNGAVLVLFALLLRSATQSGFGTMLESGLLLAAFCQVHLLNNLGPKQKPDLVYFNAFLIAIVTSFFSQDLQFGLVLLIFFPALLLALQKQVLRREQRLGRLARSILLPGIGAFALTILGFVLIPRDFRREGFVAHYLEQAGAGRGSVGFSDRVELDRNPVDPRLSRPALRIVRSNGVGDQSEDWPRYWRGSSYGRFGDRRWTRARYPQSASELPPRALWQRAGASVWRRGTSGSLGEGLPKPASEFRVEDLLSRRSWVFAPTGSFEIEFENRSVASEIRPLLDGTLLRNGPRSVGARSYTVRTTRDRELYRDADPRRFARLAERFGQAPRGRLPEGFAAFALRIERELEGLSPGLARIRVMCSKVRGAFPYALPGQPGAAVDYEAFLRGEGGGHCEWFATTLTLLLRREGVPCRLVTGFQVSDPGAQASTVIVRNLDAHAWVEILHAERGLVIFDPTPTAAEAEAAIHKPWHESMTESIAAAWQSLTSFDGKGRLALLAWIQELPGRLLATVARHPLLALVLVAGLLGALLTVRRRRRPEAEIYDYENALRRLRLDRQTGETPRERLARARSEGLATEKLERLAAATQRHEARRYATR